jgi:hypothetical protein
VKEGQIPVHLGLEYIKRLMENRIEDRIYNVVALLEGKRAREDRARRAREILEKAHDTLIEEGDSDTAAVLAEVTDIFLEKASERPTLPEAQGEQATQPEQVRQDS